MRKLVIHNLESIEELGSEKLEKICGVADLSRWPAPKHLDIDDVDEHTVEKYQRLRPRY